MSEFERITKLAERIAIAPADLSRGLARALYVAVMSAEPATTARLAALARTPQPRREASAWRRNNLVISEPLPERVVDFLPRIDAFDPFLASAARKGEVVKAVGNGFGMSGVAVARDWLVLMAESFDSASQPEAGTLTFAGGATVKTLNLALGELHSLHNAPGFDELTFAGVTAMGGHGSGLGIGPLAERISSLELLSVGPDKKPLRRTFARGDKHFPAVCTSLGALGIVTKINLEVEDAYFIEETRIQRSWDDVKRGLSELLEQQRRHELHSAEIWVNPYPVAGDISCVVGTRKKTSGPARGERGWAVTHGDRARFEALCGLMKARPRLIPFLLDAALSLAQATQVVLPSSVGLDFGATNLAPVIASECAIDIVELVPSVDLLIHELQIRARRGLWITSPIGLRFVAAGNAWLSPAFARETCTIELPMLACTPHARETLAWFVREIVPRGRPHWGQWHPLGGRELQERYPAECSQKFVRAMVELDPNGVFANDFVKDLRSSWVDATPRAATRAVFNAASGNDCASAEIRAYSRLFCDPDGVLRVDSPVGCEGVAKLLEKAKRDGVHYTTRSSGYGMHTQAIRRRGSNDKYLMFKTPGNGKRISVNAREMTLTVHADATWHEIVHETLRHGLLPQVVVTGPNATVGGTLASNSIGQACRRFGHEAEGLVSITIVVPGGSGEEPRRLDLVPPAPGDNSDEAKLFRAVVRGYGQIAVIVGAKYRLVDAPFDTSLPPVSACGARGGEVQTDRCVAVTDVAALSQDRLDEALKLLVRPESGDDGFWRACVLFKVGQEWTARVSTTHLERADFGPHLVTYEGDSLNRRLAERMLSTMPTAYTAGLVAAKVSESGASGYRDPACGFLFTMLGNEAYKDSLHGIVRAILAPTVQMTFFVPEAKGIDFLRASFEILKFKHTPGALTPELAVNAVLENKDVTRWLLELEGKARELEARYLGTTVPVVALTDRERVRRFMSDVLGIDTLIPALFELVWLPADDHLLSASYQQNGFAISLSFQGPGCNPRGLLEAIPPFSVVADELYRALRELSSLSVDLGGGVNLTKNVFVPEPAQEFIERMLTRSRLDEFAALRDKYDAQHVLTSAFADEVLGFKA